MRRHQFFCVICTMVLLALGSLGLAQDSSKDPGRGEMKPKMNAGREACANDISKFCPNEKGPRKTIDCLKKHEPELSATCKDHAAHGPHNGAPPPPSATGH